MDKNKRIELASMVASGVVVELQGYGPFFVAQKALQIVDQIEKMVNEEEAAANLWNPIPEINVNEGLQEEGY